MALGCLASAPSRAQTLRLGAAARAALGHGKGQAEPDRSGLISVPVAQQGSHSWHVYHIIMMWYTIMRKSTVAFWRALHEYLNLGG